MGIGDKEPRRLEFGFLIRRDIEPNGVILEEVKIIDKGIPMFEAISKVESWLKIQKEKQVKDFERDYGHST